MSPSPTRFSHQQSCLESGEFAVFKKIMIALFLTLLIILAPRSAKCDLLPPDSRLQSLKLALKQMNGQPQGSRVAAELIRILELNVQRWHQLPQDLGPSFLFVNIPAARLEFWHNQQLIIQMPILVGKLETPTPVLAAHLSSVDIHPKWVVPGVIVEREILPRTLADSNYLSRNRFHVLEFRDDHWEEMKIYKPRKIQSTVIRFIQESGPTNPLGLVRFNMEPYTSIYLHDTPKKVLFKSKNKLASHGCIRLEDASGLFAALTITGFLMPPTTLAQLAKDNSDLHLEVKPSLPVYIVYFTAWVDKDNNIRFEPDVYGLDKWQ